MAIGPEYMKYGVTRMDPASLRTGPTGLAALLQRPGLREALMAAGSALLAQKDQPGSFGGALGRALPIGMQAYQQGQQEAQTQQALAMAPPEMQQMLRLLPKNQQGMALFQMMTAPKPSPVAVGANERLVDPSTGQALVDAMPQPGPEAPSDVRAFQFYQGLSPEQQAAYRELHAGAPAAVINNMPGGKAASAASEALGGDAGTRVVNAATSADAALGILDTARTAKTILDNPAMSKVTGIGANVKTILERASSDPTARALAAQWDVLTSDVVMQKAKTWKGPMSEKELAFIQKAAAADRGMTVDELRAGIGLLDKIARRDLNSFVGEVESFDPKAFSVDPAQMQQYNFLAARARYKLTGELPDDPVVAARVLRGDR